MSFASRLTRCPIPYEPERAADIVQRFTAQPVEIIELLQGTAGCSPYLAGLIAREADWLEQALSGTPEAALHAALALSPDLGSDALGPALRVAKARTALLAHLPTWAVSGRWKR